MRTGVRSSLYSPPGATTEAPGTDLMSTYSFVLLTFNHERFVERAVKSALEQEGPKIEVLISDDCSTDSTVQRIESVLASTPTRHSVQFLKSSKNRGISGHWADLAGQFTGERLVYADGDDESRSDRVLRLDELWNGAARGAQLIHSDATAMDEDGRTSGPVHSNFEADPVRAVRLGQFPLGATCAFEGDVLRSFPRMSQRFSLNDIVWGGPRIAPRWLLPHEGSTGPISRVSKSVEGVGGCGGEGEGSAQERSAEDRHLSPMSARPRGCDQEGREPRLGDQTSRERVGQARGE